MEELKKKDVDEVETLRAENRYMKQKLKEENVMPLNSTGSMQRQVLGQIQQLLIALKYPTRGLEQHLMMFMEQQ